MVAVGCSIIDFTLCRIQWPICFCLMRERVKSHLFSMFFLFHSFCANTLSYAYDLFQLSHAMYNFLCILYCIKSVNCLPIQMYNQVYYGCESLAHETIYNYSEILSLDRYVYYIKAVSVQHMFI